MSTALMARRKRDPKTVAIAKAILEQYDCKNVEDTQDAIKDIFGPMFEAVLQGEMDSHLGYASNDHGPKNTQNRRNGYGSKTLKSTYGDIPVDVPRDREASFESQSIPKRTTDVSGIEDKVLSMYARGMSQRDIAQTIENLYGFEISHETISAITDRVTETAQEWQNRPLKKFYTFLFVDCLYVSIRKEMETKSHAVYGASSLKAAQAEFERFKQAWSQYPVVLDVWVRNWQHVEQLFNYRSAARKMLYTTNSIEAVNSSFRKVTKKGSFPGEEAVMAVMKALYLRVSELYKKWKGRPVANGTLVRNQPSMDDKFQGRILKYENK